MAKKELGSKRAKSVAALVGAANDAAARRVIGHSQAAKLIAIVENLPLAKAIELGSEKAYSIVRLAASTLAHESARAIVEHGVTIRKGVRRVKKLSTRGVEAMTRKVRSAGKRAAPDERAAKGQRRDEETEGRVARRSRDADRGDGEDGARDGANRTVSPPPKKQTTAVVATRKFRSRGRQLIGRVRAPFMIEREPVTWRADFEISGGQNRIRSYALGIDALQALQVAFVGLRVKLEDLDPEVQWEYGEPGETGIAREIPIGYGVQFAPEAEALVKKHAVKHVRKTVRARRKTRRIG